MKNIFFTVGPSEVYPTFEKHMRSALLEQISSISHRGTDFKDIYKQTTENLRKLMNIPQVFDIYFVGSSLESMERIIQNTVLKESFHIVSGSFGKSWFQTTQELGKKAAFVETPPGHGFDFGTLKIPKTSEVVCITQNDTSSGVQLPMEEIYYLKSKYPEKLFALDVVSSAPYVDIDYTKIDMAFLSVQKGFGLPAGLGILIVSPKSIQKADGISKKGVSIGAYHNFLTLSKNAKEFQTPETPNVLNIYLLMKITEDMLKIGIEKIRKNTDQKAKLLYNFFDNHKNYPPFVKNQTLRSKTTLVIDVKGESENLRKKLAEKGLIVGAGYGVNKGNHIRIANFPQHKLDQTKVLLKAIQSYS